jgi:hypothetical protein
MQTGCDAHPFAQIHAEYTCDSVLGLCCCACVVCLCSFSTCDVSVATGGLRLLLMFCTIHDIRGCVADFSNCTALCPESVALCLLGSFHEPLLLLTAQKHATSSCLFGIVRGLWCCVRLLSTVITTTSQCVVPCKPLFCGDGLASSVETVADMCGLWLLHCNCQLEC